MRRSVIATGAPPRYAVAMNDNRPPVSSLRRARAIAATAAVALVAITLAMLLTLA